MCARLCSLLLFISGFISQHEYDAIECGNDQSVGGRGARVVGGDERGTCGGDSHGSGRDLVLGERQREKQLVMKICPPLFMVD